MGDDRFPRILPAATALGAEPSRPREGPAAANGGRDHWLALAGLCVALGYATLRYNVFKGTPWADWPAYTVNKGLAVAALLLMAAALLRLRVGGRTGTLLMWAGGFALAHSLLSFALLDPVYYARLFDGRKLTAAAGLSLTLGAILMAGMEISARRACEWRIGVRRAMLAWIAFGTGVHAAIPAVSSWFAPAAWPGGLPPLTLIAFLVGALALAACPRSDRR